jgi:RNA polymerase sigma-70 factor (ECF subfamily)
MRRVQAGETDRFALLVGRYQGALLRVARSRLGRADWAEDVVQETFLAAFKSRHTYRDEFSFRTWLWTILLNQCRTCYARHSRAQAAVPPEAARQGAPVDGVEPWEALLSQERSDLLEALLGRLSPVQADALRLRFFGGLKFQEIADTMACSLGTAKNRVQWGLMRLSEMLAEESAEEQPIRGRARIDAVPGRGEPA